MKGKGKEKAMQVLSLFDGISCGQVALDRAGISTSDYYASEIDKYAIAVSKKNHKHIHHIGDVRQINTEFFKGTDLLLAGSPCQGFSFAGKQLNFNDPRSKLFWEFVRVLRECKPKYFLLENVRMKKEYQDIISGAVGVQPILINSALVSAQNRNRLYWTNIPGVVPPEDKKIILKDIVHENCDLADISNYIVPFDKTLKILDKEVERGKVGYFRKDSQANRIYYIHDKAVTLCGDSGGGAAKMGQYLFGSKKLLNEPGNHYGGGAYSINAKSPTINGIGNGGGGSNNIPKVVVHRDDYLFGCITPDRVNKRQNGQRFSEGNKFYTLTAQDNHGILIEGYIRKLTPIECERLQTLSDNYTEGISNSQRYKCLGNGWTVDVIAHILKGLK